MKHRINILNKRQLEQVLSKNPIFRFELLGKDTRRYFDDLINSNERYKDIFYPNNKEKSNEYIVGYTGSKIFEVQLVIQEFPDTFIYPLDHYLLSDERNQLGERFLDIVVYPEIVGLGIGKQIFKNFIPLASALGAKEFYSWTRIDKVKEVIQSYGYEYLDYCDDNYVYVYYIKDYPKLELQNKITISQKEGDED